MKAHRCQACGVPTAEACSGTNILCSPCLRRVPADVRARLEREYVQGQCDDRGLMRRAWLKAARLAVRFARDGAGGRRSAA